MRTGRRSLDSKNKKINIGKVILVFVIIVIIIVGIFFLIKELTKDKTENNSIEVAKNTENVIEENNSKTIEQIIDEFGGEVIEQIKPDTYYISKDGIEYTAYLDGEITQERIIPWDGTSAKPAVDEVGNMNVYKPEELKWIADQIISGEMNFNGVTITLRKNIDLGARKNEDGTWSGNIWTSMVGFLDELPNKNTNTNTTNETATNEETVVDETAEVTNENLKRFAGVFNGNGFSIRGLNVDTDKRYQGLFGYQSGTITNLTIKYSHIKGGEATGAIVGLNEGIIENCKIDNVEITGNNKVGGIAGISMTNSKINNCEIVGNNCYINSNNYTGGICGYINNNSEISNCINRANINGKDYIGGISGIVFYGTTIRNCFDENSNISGENYVAGLVGYSQSQIENSWNNSTTIIKGKKYIGGLVGLNYSMGNITDSYNSAKIIATEDNVGGIAGCNSANISNCYNSGIIDVNEASGVKVGGLCGQNSSESFIYTSYNIGNIYTKKNANGLIGANFGDISNSYYLENCIEVTPEVDDLKKSETDMKSNIISNLGEAFSEDINNINSGYPILKWQISLEN